MFNQLKAKSMLAALSIASFAVGGSVFLSPVAAHASEAWCEDDPVRGREIVQDCLAVLKAAPTGQTPPLQFQRSLLSGVS